jgi:Uma2 family endonuclease
MTTTTTDRFTTADLDRLDLPEGWRAEIIDGALYVSKAPGWDHQAVVANVFVALRAWAAEHAGRVNWGIGVLYADDDNVTPDVVWISAECLAHGLDAAGHLAQVGPELVVEVVSPGSENARRDREAKLALYSRRDALEYWIVDPRRAPCRSTRACRATCRIRSSHAPSSMTTMYSPVIC